MQLSGAPSARSIPPGDANTTLCIMMAPARTATLQCRLDERGNDVPKFRIQVGCKRHEGTQNYGAFPNTPRTGDIVSPLPLLLMIQQGLYSHGNTT